MVAKQPNLGAFLLDHSCIPPGFDIKRTQSRSTQNFEIDAQPIDDLPLHRSAQLQQRRERALYRSSRRQVSIGNDFEPCQSFANLIPAGPLAIIQASFICGSPTVFDRPFSVKTRVSSTPCSVRMLSGAGCSR